MLRRFRPVLLAAAVAFATPPLAAQLPGRRSAEIAPAPHPAATLQMPASLAGGAEAALEILADAAERVAEVLPGVGVQTYESGMTLPSPMYLQHYPQYFPPAPAFPLPREVVAQEAARPTVQPTGTAAGPVGTWVREVGPAKVVLTVTADRLTATARAWSDDGGKPQTVTLDADYVVLKDGTVCGVITGIDADDAETSAGLQPLAGHPFALRWRADAEVLSVRDVRCLTAGTGTEATDELSAAVLSAGGRYARVDDARRKEWEKKTPAGKAPMPKAAAARCDPLPSPVVRTIQPLPDGTTVERLGVDFNRPLPPPPAPYLPPASGPALLPCPTPVPLGPPLPTSTYLPPPPPPSPPPLPGGGPGMYPPGVAEPLDPPPAPGPWTVTPATPWQQAGPMFPGPRGYPQPVVLPPAQQPVVVPAAASFPAVSVPPPPPKRVVPVAGVSVAWHPRVVYLPDPTRYGVDNPCLVGRLFLFDAVGRPQPAAGGVKVVATDDTPRNPVGPKPLPEERWSFDLDAMKRLLAPVPEHEAHYNLVLPWAGYRPDATRVRLAVQYAQPDGSTTWAPEVVLVHPADLARPLPQPPTDCPAPAGPRSQAAPAASNPVLGTWVREQDGVQIVLTLSEKRMRLALNTAIDFAGADGPGRLTQTLDADCGIGPDGTVFGVFTGADMTVGGGFPAEVRAGAGEARKMMVKMAGTLFRFRARVDGGRLTLADAVMTPPDGSSVSAKVPPELFGSGFERVTGPVPPPKPGSGVGMFGVVNQYSSDPNVRVEQLLHQSDDVRQVDSEWKRFWLNDPPNGTTVERIHGGIGDNPKPATIPKSK